MKLTTVSIFLASAITIVAAPIPNKLSPVDRRGENPSSWPPAASTYHATNTAPSAVTTGPATGTPTVPAGLLCDALPNAQNTPNTGVAVPGDQSEAAGAVASTGGNQADQSSQSYTEPGAAQQSDNGAGCSNSGFSSASSSAGAGSGDGSGDTTSSESSSAAAAITNPNAQNAQAESESIAKSQSVNTPVGTFSVSGAASEAAAVDDNGDLALATGGGIDVATPAGSLNENSPPVAESVGQATANQDSGIHGSSAQAGGSDTVDSVDGSTAPLTTGPDQDSSRGFSQSLDNPNGDAGAIATTGTSPSGVTSESNSATTGTGGDANSADAFANSSPA